MITVDGVACCMKTSLIKALKKDGFKCGFFDYLESVAIYNEFANKRASNILTFIYAALQYSRLDRTDYDFTDRGLFSDLWYMVIYDIYDQLLEGTLTTHQECVEYTRSQLSDFLSTPEQRDTNTLTPLQKLLQPLISKYTTVYIIPPITGIPGVVQQMNIRNNGLDKVDYEYVLAQIAVFTCLCEIFKFPNYVAYKLPESNIYNDAEFNNLKKFVETLKERDL